jgi:hypothetical protein
MSDEAFDDSNETGEEEDDDLEYEENQLIKIEKRGMTTHPVFSTISNAISSPSGTVASTVSDVSPNGRYASPRGLHRAFH